MAAFVPSSVAVSVSSKSTPVASSSVCSQSSVGLARASANVLTADNKFSRSYREFFGIRQFIGAQSRRGDLFDAVSVQTRSAERVSGTETRCAFELAPLPFDKTALEPYYSANTLDFHHGKHHQTYVTNLNKLVPGTEFDGKSLEDIIKASFGKNPAVFNNSAQIFNHDFFWKSIKPGGGGAPSGALADAINSSFGSYDKFKEEFKNAAVTQFGSGWAWLVKEGGSLKIVKTGNAETPITSAGVTPLLTVDVWEHAYYLDYQNRRPDYVSVFLDNLVNWDFAASQFASA